MISVKLGYNVFCYHYFFSLRNHSEGFFPLSSLIPSIMGEEVLTLGDLLTHPHLLVQDLSWFNDWYTLLGLIWNSNNQWSSFTFPWNSSNPHYITLEAHQRNCRKCVPRFLYQGGTSCSQSLCWGSMFEGPFTIAGNLGQYMERKSLATP